MNFLKIVLLASLLSACASTPISSLWKLRNFDPLEADPNDIRLAVITDKIISLNDNSTSLSLGFSSTLSEHSFSSTFYTTIEKDAKVPELEKFKNSQEHITLFYLNEETARKMRIAQNKLRSIKDRDIEGDGGLSVNIRTGCFNGPKPEQLDASIFALFNAEQGYIKLSHGIDLMEEATKGDKHFWVQCEHSKI